MIEKEGDDDIPIGILAQRFLAQKTQKTQKSQKVQKRQRSPTTTNDANDNAKPTKMRKKILGTLFVELASPDSDGVSRWVEISEFSKDYDRLRLGNGGSWLRKGSTLDKQYHIDVDRKVTKGERIDRIRLNGIKQ
jgi:hypothetical protein